jgi:hypothetical protein
MATTTDKKITLELSLEDAKRVRNGLYEYAADVYDNTKYIEPGDPERVKLEQQHRNIYHTIHNVEQQLKNQGAL